jgi:large subunit ribosomal protein L1
MKPKSKRYKFINL